VSQDADSSEELDTFPVHPPSVELPMVNHDQEPSSTYARANNRSRTPIRDADLGGHLSRISSLECPDTDTELGPNLSRVSTAPHSGPSPSRDKRDQQSARKLARMGFSPARQAPPASGSKRFGAIRSLVQTLKGKT
jgi:hypothetical protein